MPDRGHPIIRIQIPEKIGANGCWHEGHCCIPRSPKLKDIQIPLLRSISTLNNRKSSQYIDTGTNFLHICRQLHKES